jgi:hypothetical protein
VNFAYASKALSFISVETLGFCAAVLGTVNSHRGSQLRTVRPASHGTLKV